MDFKNQPIKTDQTKSKSLDKKKLKAVFIITGALVVVFFLFSIYSLVRSLDLSTVIFSFGKKLQVDEQGHTNIMLVGIGGEGHDGADLTDSIIVASIDYDHQLVPMLSIPRDLYVKSEKLKMGERINAIYSSTKSRYGSREGLEELKTIVSDITDMPIQYVIKVDFQGFKKIVDSLGGVEVNVEKDIYDAEYPLGETNRYETFAISKGPQTLNGEMALKYARSRHGKGNELGDFDRAKRQQQLLAAIKEKAMHLNLLTDAGKIKNLYDSVASSLETDLNLNEIIELAKIGKDFGKESIISRVLTTANESCGGFLYPPAKELFSGASVLLPIGDNYDHLHQFTQLFFHHPLVAQDQSPIVVLNGTKVAVARELVDYLNRFCFNAIYATNAPDRNLAQSAIYYQALNTGTNTTDTTSTTTVNPSTSSPTTSSNSSIPPAIDFIKTLIPGSILPGFPPNFTANDKTAPGKIFIELGADYLTHRLQDPFKKAGSGTSAATAPNNGNPPTFSESIP